MMPVLVVYVAGSIGAAFWIDMPDNEEGLRISVIGVVLWPLAVLVIVSVFAAAICWMTLDCVWVAVVKNPRRKNVQ